MEDLMHLDLYGLLDIPQTSTTKDIKTAYRKKALSCHPDKNPDNPKAAELFHQLSKVLEILTDESARAAYDRVLLAKAQSKIRAERLNAKRKKFKEDLEAREQFTGQGSSAKSDEQKLREEIERLQKEGSKLVEMEIITVNEQIWTELGARQANGRTGGESARVKIKWKAAKDDPENGGYNREVLKRIFSKYGDLGALTVSGNRNGLAMVEFMEKSAAEMAVQIETGLMGNPLVLRGMWENERSGGQRRGPGQQTSSGVFGGCGGGGCGGYGSGGLGGYGGSLGGQRTSSRVFPGSGGTGGLGGGPGTFPSFSSAPDISSNRRDDDFENLVLGNLRRAEERKKLIELITVEDE